MQNDRNPLIEPWTGDIIEAIVDGRVATRLVTMMIDDNVAPITFDLLVDTIVYPSNKSSLLLWQIWCREHNAVVRQKGNC
jgi:hypothetical protein